MSKGSTEAAKRIELPWLRKQGYFPKEGGFIAGTLRWSWHGEPSGNIQVQVRTQAESPTIRVMYKVRSIAEGTEWKDMDYSFTLERVSCRYGGYKWYVRCQLVKNGVFCGRRVRVLYSVGHWFGCRHCANLTYSSCNESGPYRCSVTLPELEKMEAELKRTHYAGKPTKKYLRYLQKAERLDNAFTNMIFRLGRKADI